MKSLYESLFDKVDSMAREDSWEQIIIQTLNEGLAGKGEVRSAKLIDSHTLELDVHKYPLDLPLRLSWDLIGELGFLDIRRVHLKTCKDPIEFSQVDGMIRHWKGIAQEDTTSWMVEVRSHRSILSGWNLELTGPSGRSTGHYYIGLKVGGRTAGHNITDTRVSAGTVYITPLPGIPNPVIAPSPKCSFYASDQLAFLDYSGIKKYFQDSFIQCTGMKNNGDVGDKSIFYDRDKIDYISHLKLPDIIKSGDLLASIHKDTPNFGFTNMAGGGRKRIYIEFARSDHYLKGSPLYPESLETADGWVIGWRRHN